MKRRVLSPERLLVASIVVGIGCATPSLAQEPKVVKAAAAAPAKTENRVETLREELSKLTMTDARFQDQRFRPLCDAEGYPIVGNAIVKTIEGPGLQPSTFCGDVRARTPPDST